MPSLPLRLGSSAAPLAAGFDRIRRELGIPEAFPADAEEEAGRVAAGRGEHDGATRADRREIDLLTIDPAGSRDLDQALAILPVPGGHRVHYAIADAAAVVAPGGAIDREARSRGLTIYMPDRRTPLHPTAIGEGAASLLPGEDRSALLWTIDLDGEGEAGAVAVERALVRSRRALSYEEAQAAIDGGTGDATLSALKEVGLARLRREAERGGVSLTVPVQEVVHEGDRYALRYATPLPVEDWNAQISLLTGMAAARIMADGGMGLFRTLAPAEPRDVEALRRSARALGVSWPEGARYGDVVRALDPARPGDAAFAVRATRLFHGAGYAAWTRESGEEPPVHAAIASIYAHVTAPLRRLADRFANEVVLALQARAAPPPWAADALGDLPGVMAETGRRERSAERAAVDYVESALLASRVGEEFPATVLDVRDGRATVQLADPAVVAPLDGDGAEPGSQVRVRLASADPATRAVRFALV